MTPEQVIEFAKQHCDPNKSEPLAGGWWTLSPEELEKIINAAIAKGVEQERTTCAIECKLIADQQFKRAQKGWNAGVSAKHTERGNGALFCEAAILKRAN